MKNGQGDLLSFLFMNTPSVVGLAVRAALLVAPALVLGVSSATAITSPYVTESTNIPLNQAIDDSIQGMVTFNSHSPVEGSISSLTDAVTPDTPTANVIPGPADNTGTWVGLTWDFGGSAFEVQNRQLDRVDIWIDAHDPSRFSFHGDLSISHDGVPSNFIVIPDSEHRATLSQNQNYNLISYVFPEGMVTDFRYLRLNLGPDEGQLPRIVEIDAWISQIPEPGTYAAIFGGMALLVVGWRRWRNRRE